MIISLTKLFLIISFNFSISLSIKLSGTPKLLFIESFRFLFGSLVSKIKSNTFHVSLDKRGSPPVILNVSILL